MLKTLRRQQKCLVTLFGGRKKLQVKHQNFERGQHLEGKTILSCDKNFRGEILEGHKTFLNRDRGSIPDFLKKKIEDIIPFCGATDTPVMNISFGFQSQSGQSYSHLVEADV